jgi:hypothetical protein
MEGKNDLFRPLREAWSNAVSILGPSPSPTCLPEVATRRAGVLLGCYRRGEAEEPEIYSAAVASVLASYPQQVAYRVTDPRSGLPGRSQWLPTVAEVRAACEAEMALARDAAAREARRAETKRILDGAPSDVTRRRVLKSFEELRDARWPANKSQAEDRLGKLSADYSRTAPSVSTPDMAKYLDGMREEPIEFEDSA